MNPLFEDYLNPIFYFVVDMAVDAANFITGNPLVLLACVGVPLCGIGVAMLKRLLGTGV